MFIADRRMVSAMQPSRPPRPHAGFMPVAECAALDTLAVRARALDALDGRLRHLLPATLARECRLADVRNGRLVFLATSAAWATRLRLHQEALLAEARVAIGDTATQVVVKVAALPPVPPEPARRKPLSATAANHLRTAASSLTDPELRALFLNLASLAESDPQAEA
ncbi:MAG TPA: DciA family protein [Dokdonella sp.]|uniref:DciA family protein n=1 Tax=Dokdonella sp. TaxID=2291710 RepID=UPI0025C287A0|nr:DciA family protein [Dokdonella sp.]HNR92166.1 DciA family protein [Dokdonella sp.]